MDQGFLQQPPSPWVPGGLSHCLSSVLVEVGQLVFISPVPSLTNPLSLANLGRPYLARPCKDLVKDGEDRVSNQQPLGTTLAATHHCITTPAPWGPA